MTQRDVFNAVTHDIKHVGPHLHTNFKKSENINAVTAVIICIKSIFKSWGLNNDNQKSVVYDMLPYFTIICNLSKLPG